eukprot:6186930-Pleurochrysis_carterae.AAC.2
MERQVKPALLRRAYLSADEGYGQLLWLRPHSELAKLKPRPKYVAFFENHLGLERKYLKMNLKKAALPNLRAELLCTGSHCGRREDATVESFA